jgi:hypothetical protein
MQLARLFVCALVGATLGFTGIALSIDEQVKQHNKQLTCNYWEERDSYRHFAFNRIDYCRPRSTSTSW